MSHTLTHNQLNNPEGWGSKDIPYGQKEIDLIPDGQAGNTTHPPTSIPSPFARFDLVRTAFLRLSKNLDLTGEANDSRLVSTCFDMGQLFFHFDLFNDQIELIEWNKNSVTDTLLAPNAPEGHKRLGKALNLFLDQDGGPARQRGNVGNNTRGGYNFNRLDSLFMLRYTGQGRSLVIGGTSPSTLFFSSPEDLSFIPIKFGSYQLFQHDKPCPLHLRNDPSYQKFWYGFLNAAVHNNFAYDFPEVHEYLAKSLKLLQKTNGNLWEEIGNNAERLTLAVTEPLFVHLEPVEVIGYRIKKERPNTDVLTASELLINSEKYRRLYPDSLMPMVLQNQYKGSLRYTRDLWDKEQEVPAFAQANWRNNERKLPGQQETYPWLTVSDLLEPYIIRLVYPINRTQFLDLDTENPDPNQSQSYLLPLSRTFFDFFDVADLHKIDSGVSLTMIKVGKESVAVTLAIQLKASEPPIRLQRTYTSVGMGDKPHTPDPNQNKGAVVECQVGINLMPFVRFSTLSPHYTVQVVDRDLNAYTLQHNFQLSFHDDSNKLLVVDPPRRRSKKNKDVPASVTTSYYGLTKNFDYIILETAPGSGQRGVIVPRFDLAATTTNEDTDVFTFAVDFGTTNTHIEYITQKDTTPRPLTIDATDALIATLHDPDGGKLTMMNAVSASALVNVIPVEWLPDRVGESSRASFPTRTVLLENNPNWAQNLHAFQDFNPALLYEKQPLPRDTYEVRTNLKWANQGPHQNDQEGNKNEKRVIGYLESLVLLMRNKVLLNKGNLTQTRVIWFYPLSMTSRRRDFFAEEWNRLVAKHITRATFPHRIPESTAPYYWFRSQNLITAAEHPAVNIDIGGGTSDVVVFENRGTGDNPILISSFRFAANAIFGDGFTEGGAADQNGFIKRYKDQIIPLLTENALTDPINAFDDIYRRNRSEDIIAFFFSLKDNEEVQKKKNIDFNEMLAKDDSMKIVFLSFYAAVIYHLARLMQAKSLPMPRYIAFSGNGSKVLNILSRRPQVLAQVARLIFEDVYKRPYNEEGLSVIMNQAQPKEATCKGGLKRSLETGVNQIDFNNEADGIDERGIELLKATLLGTHQAMPQLVTRSDTYEAVTDSILKSVADEVRHFIEVLCGLDKTMSLKNEFGITTRDLEMYKDIQLKDLMENVKLGFQAKKNESDAADPLEETLFFYPLIYGLNKLAATIAKAN